MAGHAPLRPMSARIMLVAKPCHGSSRAYRSTAATLFRPSQARPALRISSLSTSSHPSSSALSFRVGGITCAQSCRRGYAEQMMAPETKQKVKRRSWSVLRWTWRATYLSVLLGLGYVGYGIYESRNPVEQAEPDPTKKTLVILGMLAASFQSSHAGRGRGNWSFRAHRAGDVNRVNQNGWFGADTCFVPAQVRAGAQSRC